MGQNVPSNNKAGQNVLLTWDKMSLLVCLDKMSLQDISPYKRGGYNKRTGTNVPQERSRRFSPWGFHPTPRKECLFDTLRGEPLNPRNILFNATLL